MERKYLIDKEKKKHYASFACMGSNFTKEEIENNVRALVNRSNNGNGSDEFWRLLHSGPYSIDETDSWVGKRVYDSSIGWVEHPNGELQYRLSFVVTTAGMTLSELVNASLRFIDAKRML